MPSKAPPALYRVLPQVQRIPLTDDPADPLAGAWAEMVMNPPSGVADVLRAEALALQRAREESNEDAYYPSPQLRPTIASALRAWNLADENGALPANEHGLAALDWSLIFTLLGAWMRGRQLPKSNGTGSNGTSAASPAPSPSGSPTLNTVDA